MKKAIIAADGTVDIVDLTAEEIAARQPVAQTHEQIVAEKKRLRNDAVEAIKVTTAAGNEYDGDEVSQGRMARAIKVAEIAGISEATWILSNNVPTVVTLQDLSEALVLSMQAQSALWSEPYL